MTQQNLQPELNNPIEIDESALAHQSGTEPKNEDEPSGTPAAAKKEEDKEEPTVEVEDIFAPFQGLREQLIEKGVDMTSMDEAFASGSELTDEQLDAIATNSGKYTREDVKAVMNLAYKNRDLAVKAAKEDEREAASLLSEYNEAAGGDFEELKTYIGTAATTDQELQQQIQVWNLMLGQTDNRELQKRALREMNTYRASKQPAVSPTTANKQSDLGLLTKANTKPSVSQPVTQQQPQETAVTSNPLEGNPLAGATVNHLAQIKLNPKHPQYEEAIAVLKVKYPHLV